MDDRTSRNCFVCGSENTSGLQAQFLVSNGAASTSFVPQRKHEGLGDVVHGAILMALLDEAMSKAASSLGSAVVTAEIIVRFKKPAKIGSELHVSARCADGRNKRVVECSAEIKEAGSDIVIAWAKGRMFISRG